MRAFKRNLAVSWSRQQIKNIADCADGCLLVQVKGQDRDFRESNYDNDKSNITGCTCLRIVIILSGGWSLQEKKSVRRKK